MRMRVMIAEGRRTKARRTATSENRTLGAGEEHVRSLETHEQAVYSVTTRTHDVTLYSQSIYYTDM